MRATKIPTEATSDTQKKIDPTFPGSSSTIVDAALDREEEVRLVSWTYGGLLPPSNAQLSKIASGTWLNADQHYSHVIKKNGSKSTNGSCSRLHSWNWTWLSIQS